MSQRQPFDDLIDLVKQLSDTTVSGEGKQKIPSEADGAEHVDVGEILPWLATWQRKAKPKLNESHICIFASSYAEHGGQDDLKKFIEGASKGQEPVSKLCKERGVGLRVLEMAPEIPHVVSQQWPENECMAATAFGMEATAAGGNIVGLAALAPGNELFCSQFCISLIKEINNKNQIVTDSSQSYISAIKILNSMRSEVGREVAAMAGAMVAARSRNLPVLVEGWSGLAALCILTAIDPASAGHVKVASVENNAQTAVANALGRSPIVGNLVNLGPGCGVAIAFSSIAPLLNLAS